MWIKLYLNQALYVHEEKCIFLALNLARTVLMGDMNRLPPLIFTFIKRIRNRRIVWLKAL
jgi:hypothetical protein